MASDGSGMKFANQERVGIAGSVTLYAQWMKSSAATPVITLYRGGGYTEASQTLSVGQYGSAMEFATIGNDQLSSIKVPDGYSVTLYEHADFQGNKVVLTSDADWLGDFNDKTSSIEVTKLPA